MTTSTQQDDTQAKFIRTMQGVVVSDKMDKTRVIEVQKVKYHPLYKKRYIVSKRYYAHDENNETAV